MAVDIAALTTTIVTNATSQGGVKSISGDEGSTVLPDSIRQLPDIEELRHRQHVHSTKPVPAFDALQTFSYSAGLAGGNRRSFNRR